MRRWQPELLNVNGIGGLTGTFKTSLSLRLTAVSNFEVSRSRPRSLSSSWIIIIWQRGWHSMVNISVPNWNRGGHWMPTDVMAAPLAPHDGIRWAACTEYNSVNLAVKAILSPSRRPSTETCRLISGNEAVLES